MDFYGIVSARMIFVSCNNIVAIPYVYSLLSRGNFYFGIRAHKNLICFMELLLYWFVVVPAICVTN
jgi:hypothetical protein